MSADILRRAASLMRERAEAARAGTWTALPSALIPDTTLVLADWGGGPRRVAHCAGSLPAGNEANAEHIASWHPAVALAVADVLEAEAYRVERNRHTVTYEGLPMFPASPAAIAVARAYLGEAA